MNITQNSGQSSGSNFDLGYFSCGIVWVGTSRHGNVWDRLGGNQGIHYQFAVALLRGRNSWVNVTVSFYAILGAQLFSPQARAFEDWNRKHHRIPPTPPSIPPDGLILFCPHFVLFWFTHQGEQRDEGGGEGGLICSLPCNCSTIGHASISGRITVPNFNRDTSNIWALITLLPYVT